MRSAFRLAVVNSHPIQYFAPLYAYLNRDPSLEVTALYCSDFSLRGGVDPGFKQSVTWDVDLLHGYRSVFLGKNVNNRTPAGFWSLICPQVWSEIRDGNYDAVLLHGYNYAVNIVALLAAKTRGLPVFMRSETHSGLRRNRVKRWCRDMALSIAFRHIDGFLAIGTVNRAYYRSLKVPKKKIFDVPYTVDNDRFIAAAALTTDERVNVKKRYGLSLDRPVILYASKFMRRKHPDDVIRAAAVLVEKGFSLALLMVGTGEMEDELRALVASLRLEHVVFGGFVNQAELPTIFSASDIFVLPSENEPWGLIVNEAMCAGLPVVVSDEVGCVPDLVADGVNGYRIKAGTMDTLVEALEKLLLDEPARHRMGAASLSIIGNWNYEKCRRGVLAALNHCVKLE